jgi:hypothetical protein
MIKDKLLVVEAASHPKVLENLYFLFNKHFITSFLTIPDKYKNYSQLMPDVCNSGTLKITFHSTLIFLQLIFIGFRYKYIHISTGPESYHYSRLWTKPLFLICCFLYNKKVLLTIKNSNHYLKNRNLNFSYYALRYINIILFETNTMKTYFDNETNNYFNTYVIYDRYIDQLPSRYIGLKSRQDDSLQRNFKVGLLGSLNSSRRDYDLLIKVFNKLNTDLLDRFELILLGECRNGKLNEIAIKLSQSISFKFKCGFLDVDEFDNLGSSCDILISPLINDKNYGTVNGSGSFGDAVYLRKPIIIPQRVDPMHEFSDISFYYENYMDLIYIFENIELFLNKYDSNNLEKYSSDNVYSKLMKKIL